jgi:hypothetical protein
MAKIEPRKALLTAEASQTLALGGVALGLVGLMLVRRPFAFVCFIFSIICCGGILIVNWTGISLLYKRRQLSKHLVLPAILIFAVPALSGWLLLQQLFFTPPNEDVADTAAAAADKIIVGPQIQILGFDLAPPQKDSPYYYNVYYRNIGDRPAVGITGSSAEGIYDHVLLMSEEDFYFNLLNKIPLMYPSGNSEVPPNIGDAVRYYESQEDRAITSKIYLQMQKENFRRPWYIMARFTYTDRGVGRRYISEYCGFMFLGAHHLCLTHNKIYRVGE